MFEKTKAYNLFFDSVKNLLISKFLSLILKNKILKLTLPLKCKIIFIFLALYICICHLMSYEVGISDIGYMPLYKVEKYVIYFYH